MKTLDINNWKRKEHFEFFSNYDEPYFGIASELDCTKAFNFVKDNKISFFAYYLHKAIIAANHIEEFKYRLIKKDIVIFDEIHAATTIGRKDETFAFTFVTYNEDFIQFNKSLKKEIEEVQNCSGLRLNDNGLRKDVVHFSTIPWHSFTGLTQPRNFNNLDCEPKIVFGKTVKKGNELIMPVSISVHHGLMDGVHVAKYLKLLQKLLNE